MERITAFNDHTVLGGCYVSAHGGEIFRHDRDSVGFLDLQLSGVPDQGGAFCEAGHHSKDGKLIDEGRDQIAFDGTALEGGGADQQICGGFPAVCIFIQKGHIGVHQSADL